MAPYGTCAVQQCNPSLAGVFAPLEPLMIHSSLSHSPLDKDLDSVIPLLNISVDFHTAEMSSPESSEKGDGAAVMVGPAQSASSPMNPYGENATIAYEDEGVVANQGRLRRLFSFVQLLAFALTFMSS